MCPVMFEKLTIIGSGGLMVLADIMLDGRRLLYVFERGSVTDVRYRDEILEPKLDFSGM